MNNDEIFDGFDHGPRDIREYLFCDQVRFWKIYPALKEERERRVKKTNQKPVSTQLSLFDQ